MKTMPAALSKPKAHDQESPAAVVPVILDVPPAKELDDAEHIGGPNFGI